MMHKSVYFEQTDKYLSSELTHPELTEYESQLAVDSGLSEELNLHLDIEQAVGEQDIISLRSNLSQIVHNQPEIAYIENTGVIDTFSFGLTEEFSVEGSLGNQLNAADIFNLGHSLPKIHLYQHKIAGKENLHKFYKEQSGLGSSHDTEFEFTLNEEKLFTEVQAALEETDITDIRANLKQIAQNIPTHQYSIEEIEGYLYDMKDSEIRHQIEEELAINPDLFHEMELIRDIDLAGAESDVIALRGSLNALQKSETQRSTASIKEIEEYIHNELIGEDLSLFEAELASNKKLEDEIAFIKSIDRALKESDIMRLRANLEHISEEISTNKHKERSFAGRFTVRRIALSTVAACMVFLIGISGILSESSTSRDLYQKYYNKYASGVTVRSASINANKILSEALFKYENQDYTAALDLFNQVILSNPGNMAGHFYAGVSLQETGRYRNAIKEYESVIENKDNLFTEQAEWYTGLCYLQTNEDKKAFKQFKKIAQGEGFYQQKAEAILRKMKYTETNSWD